MTETVNNKKLDVLQKHITLNCSNGILQYFVHGKEIPNNNYEQLVPKLVDPLLLVNILLKFEKMCVCRGLNEIYISYMNEKECYKDKCDLA